MIINYEVNVVSYAEIQRAIEFVVNNKVDLINDDIGQDVYVDDFTVVWEVDGTYNKIFIDNQIQSGKYDSYTLQDWINYFVSIGIFPAGTYLIEWTSGLKGGSK